MRTSLYYNFRITLDKYHYCYNNILDPIKKHILMWFPMSSKYLKSLEVFEYVIVWSSKKDWCKNNWRFDIDTVSKLHKLVLTVCKLISSITIRWNDIAKKRFSISLHSQDPIKRNKFALSFLRTKTCPQTYEYILLTTFSKFLAFKFFTS